MRSRFGNRVVAIGMCVSMATAVLSACGSGAAKNAASTSNTTGSSSAGQSSSLAQFSSAVTADENPSSSVTWISQPDPAPKNKKVMILSCSQATTGCKGVTAQAALAAKALGWTASVFDGQDSPSRYNQGIQQAIAEGDQGILLVAINQSYIQQSLTAAEAKGIKVASVVENNAPGGTGKVQADVYAPPDGIGTAVADWIITATKGKGHVLILETPEFPSVYDMVAPFKAEFAKCPGCSIVKEQTVDFATATTQLSPTVKGILAANPDINYIYSPFGDIAPFVGEGVSEAGDTGKVGIIDTECQPPSIKQVQAGGPTVACIATPEPYAGWFGTDLLVRLFDNLPVPLPNGQLPYTTTKALPFMLTTKSNVATATNGAGGFWNGNTDYSAHFEKLWGIGS